MKISKDSWHYEMYDFMYGRMYEKVSLCVYFWKVMASVAVLSIVAVVACILSYFALNLLAFLITGVLGFFVSWVNVQVAMFTLLVLGVTSFCMGAGATISGDMKVFPKWISKYFPKRSMKAKTPSLVSQAYKAHKEKFCPYVEVE